MQVPQETVIGYLPSEDDQQRLAVVRCEGEFEQRYELRQQSWGNGLGWFTQSCVQLDPSQASALRNLLGVHPIDKPARLRVVG